METRRAGGVMVHPSVQWSKRQRGVGGQWQPASKAEFCHTVRKRTASHHGSACSQLLEWQRTNKGGSGGETMTVALLSHSILICRQHELTFYI